MPRSFVAASHADLGTSALPVVPHMDHLLALEDTRAQGLIRSKVVQRGCFLGKLTLEKGPSPIKMLVLEKWLELYPDEEAASYLRKGFRGGFRIPFQGKRVAADRFGLNLDRIVKSSFVT